MNGKLNLILSVDLQVIMIALFYKILVISFKLDERVYTYAPNAYVNLGKLITGLQRSSINYVIFYSLILYLASFQLDMQSMRVICETVSGVFMLMNFFIGMVFVVFIIFDAGYSLFVKETKTKEENISE